jgi:hypothetical protein
MRYMHLNELDRVRFGKLRLQEFFIFSQYFLSYLIIRSRITCICISAYVTAYNRFFLLSMHISSIHDVNGMLLLYFQQETH